MNERIHFKLQALFERYPQLIPCKKDILAAYEILVQCYQAGGKLLICGNGGSAADSDHIVGELMKGFLLRRPMPQAMKERIEACCGEQKAGYYAQNLQAALPAISLTQQAALLSAFANDVEPVLAFAQQVYGYGKAEDALMGISTSGNSINVIHAVQVARAMGLRTIGLTGKEGGMLTKLCDCTICVPEKETFQVQEYHLPVYHTLCAMLEERFFG